MAIITHPPMDMATTTITIIIHTMVMVMETITIPIHTTIIMVI
jgi:hypothetical protein